MLTRSCIAVLAVLAAVPFHTPAEAQNFEDMVEDALKGAAPGEAPPPATAVPPRLGVAPQPSAPPAASPIAPPAGAPDASSAAPPLSVPVQPPAVQPPAAAQPSESPMPGLAAPAIPAVPAPPGEPTMAELKVDEVNAATFTDEPGALRGASPLILKTQILLDRAGASPGVIDSLNGNNVAKAIAAVETVLSLPVDGRLDPKVWAALGGDTASPVLVSYTIIDQDVAGPFIEHIPEDYAEQAKLPCLCFTGPAEMFAERFHMDIKLLKALNPGADFGSRGRRSSSPT